MHQTRPTLAKKIPASVVRNYAPVNPAARRELTKTHASLLPAKFALSFLLGNLRPAPTAEVASEACLAVSSARQKAPLGY